MFWPKRSSVPTASPEAPQPQSAASRALEAWRTEDKRLRCTEYALLYHARRHGADVARAQAADELSVLHFSDGSVLEWTRCPDGSYGWIAS